MKRHYPAVWSMIVVLVVAGMLLAACGGPSTPTPTPLPTATATPRSTPLPEVPTAVPLASADRPVTIYMVPQDSELSDDDAAVLAEQIVERSGLNLEVAFVAGYGEILAHLCSADPAIGWLDGVTYLAAEAQGCAEPALQLARGRETGYSVDFLMNADIAGEIADAGDIAALSGRTLCRLGVEDTVSWFVAGLMLQRAGVNPLYDLGGIVDVDDYDALVRAVYDGDCFGGAVPADYLRESLSDDLAALEDLTERVLLVDTSPEIPFGVLVYPQTVPLNIRIPVDELFQQMISDPEQRAMLAAVLDLSRVSPVTRASFDEVRAFMQETGLDFAALGE